MEKDLAAYLASKLTFKQKSLEVYSLNQSEI